MRTFLISAWLLLSCASAHADLSDLLEIARNQAEVHKDYQKESSSYMLAKAAYDRGAIAKGRTKADISGQFGDPVVILWDKDLNLEKWIYKKAPESFFGGEQLYVYFDQKGLLANAVYRAKDTVKEDDDGAKK